MIAPEHPSPPSVVIAIKDFLLKPSPIPPFYSPVSLFSHRATTFSVQRPLKQHQDKCDPQPTTGNHMKGRVMLYDDPRKDRPSIQVAAVHCGQMILSLLGKLPQSFSVCRRRSQNLHASRLNSHQPKPLRTEVRVGIRGSPDLRENSTSPKGVRTVQKGALVRPTHVNKKKRCRTSARCRNHASGSTRASSLRTDDPRLPRVLDRINAVFFFRSLPRIIHVVPERNQVCGGSSIPFETICRPSFWSQRYDTGCGLVDFEEPAHVQTRFWCDQPPDEDTKARPHPPSLCSSPPPCFCPKRKNNKKKTGRKY